MFQIAKIFEVLNQTPQAQRDLNTIAQQTPQIRQDIQRAEEGVKQFALASLTLQAISTAAIVVIATAAYKRGK